MNIGALIPAYNEARHIADVVERALRRTKAVYVVDDGSTDDTGARAVAAGAALVARAKNGGKGQALRDGLERCFADGLDAVVCLDGDGQHLPEEIDVFRAAAEAGGADLAVGNRMDAAADMPFVRRTTNRFTSWVLGRLCRGRARVVDTQCGFRLVSRRCWEGIEIRGRNFEFEGEMIVAAARAGFTVVNVPVTTVYGDEKSNIRPVLDTIRFFRMVYRLWRRE